MAFDADALEQADDDDRFALYGQLFLPLENVKQNPTHHPEGDALCHSLQVLEHAMHFQSRGKFLLAALLYDVGKAIRPARSRRRRA